MSAVCAENKATTGGCSYPWWIEGRVTCALLKAEKTDAQIAGEERFSVDDIRTGLKALSSEIMHRFVDGEKVYTLTQNRRLDALLARLGWSKKWHLGHGLSNGE